MIAMNYSSFKNNMRSVFERCTDDAETVIVTRKDNRNIVVMSEEAYNNLLENLYLRTSKANYQHLLHSIAQAKAGKLSSREPVKEQ